MVFETVVPPPFPSPESNVSFHAQSRLDSIVDPAAVRIPQQGSAGFQQPNRKRPVAHRVEITVILIIIEMSIQFHWLVSGGGGRGRRGGGGEGGEWRVDKKREARLID